MLIQFQTKDNSYFVADLERLTWARVSAPAGRDNSEVLENGIITALGFGRFALTPRTSKTEGAGNGISNFGVMPLVQGQRLTIIFTANVPTKNFTLVLPVVDVQYAIHGEVAEDEPASLNSSVEPITVPISPIKALGLLEQEEINAN